MSNREPRRKQNSKPAEEKRGHQNLRVSAECTSGQPPALEDWLFIDKENHHCPEDEKPYLLEYEYAREALDYRVPFPSALTWQQIFGNRFPETPFLSFDPVERRELLTTAFRRSAGKPPLYDFTRKDLGLSYQFEYSLKPAYQDQLEDVHERVREDLELTLLHKSYDEAINEFKQKLPQDAYDESIAHVHMTIRFNKNDDKLKEAFAAMLVSIRRVDPDPLEHNELNAKLTRLAATRLWRKFRSTEKARSYVYSLGYESPYADPGGWSRARTEVWRTLGVNAFPPTQLDSKELPV